MFGIFNILRPNTNTLILQKSRKYTLLKLTWLSICLSAWYVILFQTVNFNEGISGHNSYKLIPFIFPLVIFSPDISSFIKNIFYPRKIVFDSELKIVRDGNRKKIQFDEVELVQIKFDRDLESGDKYILSLVLKNKKKLRIDKTGIYAEIIIIADEIAQKIGVEIEKKE